MKTGKGMNAVLYKNDVHEVEFIDMTHDAKGVCKIDGFPVFVKDALKGEKALIRVVKVNKNFAFGRLVEIKEESPFRKIPICEHFSTCGGCDTMHMSYEMQLSFKRHRVKETLRKIAHVEPEIHKTIGMENPFYYRNKAIIPFEKRKGRIMAGFYKNRSREVVDLKRCHIIPKVFSEIVRYLKGYFQNRGITIYDDERKTGCVRAVMLRQSFTYDEIALTLILGENRFPDKNDLIEGLLERFPNIVSVVKSINTTDSTTLLGGKSRTIYGKDLLRDRLLGFEYQISHKSFYQVNPVQTVRLYKEAMRLAKPGPDDVMVDAYSGVGTLTLPFAQRTARVIGIENVKEAVKNAQENASYNDIENIEFLHGDAAEVMKGLDDESIDILVLDPPRKGCEKGFLQAVMAMDIPRIVYVSCNVSTLARDANILSGGGYQVKEAVPFDMFPQTSHIETVMLLEK